MKITDSNQLVFSISIDDIQIESINRINRKLDEQEINNVTKGLDYGISSSLDIVYKTIFSEMIEQKK